MSTRRLHQHLFFIENKPGPIKIPRKGWAFMVCIFGLLALSLPATRAAGDAARITCGQARFTVVTPLCLRLEYQAQGKFIDEPSMFAVNRSLRFDRANVETSKDQVVINTGAIVLTYKPDGHPFGAQNLQAVIRKGKGTVVWKPGMADNGNLGGTLYTLDRIRGAVALPDGLLSRSGWHLLDDSQRPLFTADWVKARPRDAGTDWYLFGYGDDYKLALQTLTALGGEIPLPRRYALGAWYSRYWPYTSEDYRKIVGEYAGHGFPLDVMVMDMDWHQKGWTGYTWDRQLLPDAEKLLAWFHQQGLAVTLNDHPFSGVGAHEECYPAFMKAMGEDPASRKVLSFDAGRKSYLEPFYNATHAPLNKLGVDFWWLDLSISLMFTRSIPTLSNLAILNYYYFQRSMEEGRRGISFSRWAGWGDHRHPIHFSGDAAGSFAMLTFEVPFTATAGNVGCFFWSHDIGGFWGSRNDETYARWCQFGAFSPALRSHSDRSASGDRRPWTYAPWAEQSMRRSFQLRSRFFPYTYSAVRQACTESIPLIRPMYLEEPGEEAAYHQPQQYLYGDHLLVAPITEPGCGPNRLGRQVVWFPPAGTWYNFFTGESYAGGTEALVAATIDEFPLYLRGGRPIPMRPFTQRMATDPLNELIVRCYPGADGQTSTTSLYEDDGLTAAYRQGAFAQTPLTYARSGDRITIRIAPAQGQYAGQPQQRAYTIELPGTTAATNITVDGAAAQGQYDDAQALNRIPIPARSIRQGCVVQATAPAIAADVLALRAFAQRTGLEPPTAPATMEQLLSDATGKTTNAAHRAAIQAAAGIGVFVKNENVYGYPEKGVARHFMPRSQR